MYSVYFTEGNQLLFVEVRHTAFLVALVSSATTVSSSGAVQVFWKKKLAAKSKYVVVVLGAMEYFTSF